MLLLNHTMTDIMILNTTREVSLNIKVTQRVGGQKCMKYDAYDAWWKMKKGKLCFCVTKDQTNKQKAEREISPNFPSPPSTKKKKNIKHKKFLLLPTLAKEIFMLLAIFAKV